MKHLSHDHRPLPRMHDCLLVVLSAVLILGCADGAGGRQKVTGLVLWDDKPLEGGWIHFRPVGDGPSSAAEIKEGEFKIDAAKGLLPGSYAVSIEYLKPTGQKVQVYTGETIEEERQVIPPRYNQQTTLTTEIQSTGSNHLTFELTSKG